MTVFRLSRSTLHALRLSRFWFLLRSRSLFWQLLLLFLLIVLVAVMTMGLSMNWLAQYELDNDGDHNNLQKGNA